MTGMKEGAGEDPFADSDGTTTEANERGETPASGESDRREQPPVEIPYKFRRDSVQEGRNRVPLFLQADTKRAERDTLRELEERFDDDVSLTDLREALTKTGLKHLDEVAKHLEEWGYGMTFEE